MRKAACNFERDTEPDHTAADDNYAVTRIGHCVRDCTVAQAASSRASMPRDPLVYDESPTYALPGINGGTRRRAGDGDLVRDGLVPFRKA